MAPRKLESYLCGRWQSGAGEGIPLLDPSTEEVLATSTTEGLDFGAALAYARERGGPALRALTFAERGALLSAMSKTLHAHRDTLLDLAMANGGNTRGDAKFDVDGASLTLSFYGKLGQSLGDRRVLVDGDMEQLTRSPRYVGGHFYHPLRGAAVHVNAYNFPAWGLAEKAAVALLAGLPVVTKPATSTALVSEEMMRVLVAAGILPDGALQLIAGEPGDLIEHLGDQDVLAFTGSARTGNLLRGQRHIVDPSIRVNVEADSLNSAILGPDVEHRSETWELFLREVVTDMTQKAGQKCTAIRRIFVPDALLDLVTEDLRELLGAVAVGDPRERGVRMGPVATRAQEESVRAGLDELRRVAEPVFGDGGRGGLVGVDGDKGFFVTPVLLRANDSAAAHAVHEREVFGPVATLLPYSGSAQEAVAHVQRGRGSLVSSVYSDDVPFVGEVVEGIAAFCGRITLGSARVAEHSPGPGTVLPALVHGGPGRAGGGEELGGVRGMTRYMQRTAVQGSKLLLEKILPVECTP